MHFKACTSFHSKGHQPMMELKLKANAEAAPEKLKWSAVECIAGKTLAAAEISLFSSIGCLASSGLRLAFGDLGEGMNSCVN